MCLSGFEAQVSDSNPASPKLFDSDPDPYFHFEGEPDPDPNFSMFNGKFWVRINSSHLHLKISILHWPILKATVAYFFKLVLTSFKHTYSIIE